jgi:polar amino acid transport system substrate-binding protein
MFFSVACLPLAKGKITLLSFLFFSNIVFSKSLVVGAVLYRPPYVFPSTESGIELEIVKASLSVEGYSVEFKYMPFTRRISQLIAGKLDGAMTVNENSGLKLYYSEPYVQYKNVVISLKKRSFDINAIEQLRTKKITAYVSASTHLGPAFTKVATGHPQYEEITLLESIVAFLFLKRTDVIIIEEEIFNYFRKHSSYFNGDTPVKVHYLFPEIEFKVAFINKEVRDDFNRGLQHIRSTGLYDQIVEKYLE